MSKSYGITPAYLAWKKSGSPGVFCLQCDQPAYPGCHAGSHVTPEMRTWAQERVRKLKASGALQIREDEKCEHKKYWLNCALCQRTPKYMQ
jgi:hypothetical protein